MAKTPQKTGFRPLKYFKYFRGLKPVSDNNNFICCPNFVSTMHNQNLWIATLPGCLLEEIWYNKTHLILMVENP